MIFANQKVWPYFDCNVKKLGNLFVNFFLLYYFYFVQIVLLLFLSLLYFRYFDFYILIIQVSAPIGGLQCTAAIWLPERDTVHCYHTLCNYALLLYNMDIVKHYTYTIHTVQCTYYYYTLCIWGFTLCTGAILPPTNKILSFAFVYMLQLIWKFS